MANPYDLTSYEGDDELGLDLMGEDDDFGADPERRVARLLRTQARLQAMLATVKSPLRRKRVQARLAQISRKLKKLGVDPEAMSAAVAASGIEGVGSLLFTAQSPPGLGRLLRLPFYPTEANAAVVTSNGLGSSSFTNPVFIEDPSSVVVGGCSGTTHLLQTPQISWATLRIVGFETTSQVVFRGISNPGGRELVADLKIGGGANLFTHEDFADASIYDANQPQFCGLRDYPILRSPNVAEVAALYVGDTAGETATVSCSLLVEVLVDDNYGAHIPGPYARKGAMVRQGGAFR